MDKPDSWFLLPKCHFLPQVFFKHFASKNQLPGFYISGALVENGLKWIQEVDAGFMSFVD